MELYIDLSKGINRGKLVKRAVQVKGKNGKVFTRMQWVDPTTGQPVSEHHNVEENVPKKKSRKEHIDEHVKNMSREDKYAHISKHGLIYKRNDHPSIDHKNAVMAIKEHLYKNPHLAGAEHLDDEVGDKTPEGDDKINAWTNKYAKKDREKLYKMMHHAGIIDDPRDPNDVPEWRSKKDGGNGSAPIRHMKNMMALKKYLKENPDKMDEYDNNDDFSVKDSTPKSTPNIATPEKPKSKAQQGGNDINSIMKNMPANELYEIAKRLGIADQDPRTVAQWASKDKGGDGSAPIRHMKIFMALKSAIQKDPSILNLDQNGDLSPDEVERLKGQDEDEQLKDKVDNFLKEVSKETKLKWADEHENHELMKNRITSSHENVDNMHKVSALKKIILDNPELMEKGSMKEDFDREQLLNLKIGNKMMQKILLNVVGLKGIGDVKSEERNVEWSFGVASFARINEEDDGSLVLSVVDAGKDGEDWNEHQFPLEEVKKYIDSLKSGDTTTLKAKEIPLHKKPIPDIWKELSASNMSSYTDEVGEVLKPSLHDSWIASGRSTYVFTVANHSTTNPETMGQVFEKLGVPLKGNGRILSIDSDEFKKVVYGHLIDKEKTKDANDYVQKWKDSITNEDRVDTWLLHESAKNWEPHEREKARKEILKTNIVISGSENRDGDRMVKLVHHIHKSLEHVPFDLLTDALAIGGCKMHFTGTSYDNSPVEGCFFTESNNSIYMTSNYYHDSSLLEASHPMEHIPKSHPIQIDGKEYVRLYTPLADVMSHEFAHAIDHFMSGKNGYLEWDSKYAGSNPNAVKDSYKAAVERSNPKKLVGSSGGAQKYMYHKDEWMSSYEGRIYDPAYYHPDLNKRYLEISPNREVTDKGWETRNHRRGLEHWSENSSRFGNALSMFRQWKEENGDTRTTIDEWAEDMHEEFLMRGYGDESNHNTVKHGNVLKSYARHPRETIHQIPSVAYGYFYHRMKQSHPELLNSLHEIYGRGDFLGRGYNGKMVGDYNKGDFTRKSDLPLVIEL